VVIDGLLGFAAITVQPERLSHFYQALTSQLRELGVTTLCTAEVPDTARPLSHLPLNQLTPIAENLILLRHVEQAGRLKRLVSILKLRDSAFDPLMRGFDIVPGGIVILDDGGNGQANAAGAAADA
jgi:circadian clock protein KaiC